MTKETPKDDPHQQSGDESMKNTDQPWKKPGQSSQQVDPEISKPDLENWQESNTH